MAAIAIEPRKVITTYTTVTLSPNSESNRAMIMGLSTGEEKRKDMVGPKGTPPFRRPAVMGTVEHEQKGVTAPRPAPSRYWTHVIRFDKKSLTREGGRYSIRMPTIKETATKISTSSHAIIRKNLPAVTKLFKANIYSLLMALRVRTTILTVSFSSHQ
jgi:hypothetical protein